MLERDAELGVIWCEAAPGCDVGLVGLLQLGEIAFEAWSFGEEPEEAVLVEDVDLVAPDHVIDGREFAAIADEGRGQACDAVFHWSPPEEVVGGGWWVVGSAGSACGAGGVGSGSGIGAGGFGSGSGSGVGIGGGGSGSGNGSGGTIFDLGSKAASAVCGSGSGWG